MLVPKEIVALELKIVRIQTTAIICSSKCSLEHGEEQKKQGNIEKNNRGMKIKLKPGAKNFSTRFIEYDLEYEVLIISIVLHANTSVNVHFFNDFNILEMFDIILFDVIDDSLPEGFILKVYENYMEISHINIAYPGFLEDFYNDDPTAIEHLRKAFPQINIGW